MIKYNNITRFRLIEEIAEQTVRRFYKNLGSNETTAFPIAIEDIARVLFRYSCYVSSSLQNSSADGVLEKSNKLVLINPRITKQRGRFTLAHELAHAILADLDAETKAIIYNIPVNAKEKIVYQSIEHAADALAGALLMPSSVISFLLKHRTYVDETGLLRIASELDVSISACFFRLVYLRENGNLTSLQQKLAGINNLAPSITRINQLYRDLILRNQGRISLAKDWLPPHTPWFNYANPTLSLAIKHLEDIFHKMGIFTAARNGKAGASKSPLEVLERPFIIEFSGTPNTGKEEQIQIMVDYLRSVKNLRVKVYDDPFRICPIRTSYRSKLLWVWAITLQRIMEAKTLDQYDVVIFDKGLFDVLSHFPFYYSQGHFSAKEMNKYISSAKTRTFSSAIDLVFYFQIPPRVSINRENKFPGKIVDFLSREYSEDANGLRKQNLGNTQGLELLNSYYNHAIKEYKNLFKIIKLIDEGETSRLDLSKAILSKTVSRVPTYYRRSISPLLATKDDNQQVLPGMEQFMED